ncbi:UPF0481 protein At3g47200-like [Humulus lupulus]|uniref:UPF0481 protein At3g47200-like n=1 Tax=Humulus lupulus TaxID=3486 RepID=UPI002B400C78|nr:UPF0481 protein At3g47200-like [Humulus lupulus]
MSNKCDENHEIIDVEALVSSKFEKELSGNLVMSSLCSIFRVPTILSRHNTAAFTPNAFSFGPFHHNSKQLKPTKKIKQKYLLDLVSRLSKPNPNVDPNLLKNFTKAINEIQNKARQYYAGPVDDMKEEEFLEMLVLDGCFIIELFRKKSYTHLRGTDDPIFTMPCLLQFLYHDLILLENQMPWLVLETLFELTKTRTTATPSIDENMPLVALVIDFFGNIFSNESIPRKPLLCADPDPEYKHILDLLRKSLILNSSTIEKQKSHQWEPMHPATDLWNSGIKFQVNTRSPSLLDITFCSKTGVMLIPELLIQETTETVFRNLISLEQCCPNYEPIFTSYAFLLDNLINGNADIQILCKSKAIINWLNIDDATKLFNRLYIDTFVKEYYYYPLTNEVNNYRRRHWPRYRRVLTRDYFKHPWALISVIAASIALILTFLQTVFAIIGKDK